MRSTNTVFVVAILKKYEGWTGGVLRWIFFSQGFQLAFTCKTVFKALDRDLHLYGVVYGATRPLFVHT